MISFCHYPTGNPARPPLEYVGLGAPKNGDGKIEFSIHLSMVR